MIWFWVAMWIMSRCVDCHDKDNSTSKPQYKSIYVAWYPIWGLWCQKQVIYGKVCDVFIYPCPRDTCFWHQSPHRYAEWMGDKCRQCISHSTEDFARSRLPFPWRHVTNKITDKLEITKEMRMLTLSDTRVSLLCLMSQYGVHSPSKAFYMICSISMHILVLWNGGIKSRKPLSIRYIIVRIK